MAIPSTFRDCHSTTLLFVTADRHPKLGPQPESTLDVLWVSTVSGDELFPSAVNGEQSWFDSTAPFDPDAQLPVHGTMTVDVRSARDRQLLQRLLTSNRVLSVTAADGWSQRVRLVGIRKVDTEVQSDGSQLVVATYAWISAACFN